jgi:hypothetical protein
MSSALRGMYYSPSYYIYLLTDFPASPLKVTEMAHVQRPSAYLGPKRPVRKVLLSSSRLATTSSVHIPLYVTTSTSTRPCLNLLPSSPTQSLLASGNTWPNTDLWHSARAYGLKLLSPTSLATAFGSVALSSYSWQGFHLRSSLQLEVGHHWLSSYTGGAWKKSYQ